MKDDMYLTEIEVDTIIIDEPPFYELHRQRIQDGECGCGGVLMFNGNDEFICLNCNERYYDDE